MKLSDVMTKEDDLLRNLISNLHRTKKNLLLYTKLSAERFDSEIDHITDVFGSGSLEETIKWDIDKEGELFRMMSIIDQWVLTLRRMHMNKDKEEKDWFGDDELEKKQVYRVKDPSETDSE